MCDADRIPFAVDQEHDLFPYEQNEPDAPEVLAEPDENGVLPIADDLADGVPGSNPRVFEQAEAGEPETGNGHANAAASPDAEPLSALETGASEGDSQDDASADEADALPHEATLESEPDEEAALMPFDAREAEKRLLLLQQDLRALGIPVVIVLEGWSAAGKGAMAGELLEGLDPRGYEVHVPERFPEAHGYPELRDYWVRMPRNGHISLFIGSWYAPLLKRCVEQKSARKADAYETVCQMESMLAADGVVLLKFFLSVRRGEQKRRLRELKANKRTSARVTRADLEQNERYDEWRTQYNLMLSATSATPWHVLNGEDKRVCKRQLYETVLARLQAAIDQRRAGLRPWDVPALPGVPPSAVLPMPHLDDFSALEEFEGDYAQELKRLKKRLRKLQYDLYRRGVPMVLVFEGWDAAGKGGCIRRLSSALDPRGFTVAPIASPTAEEKEHHHLWRFWRAIPRGGHIVIFDRSWYGRVMVERIEGFCTEAQWRRAYEEMNLFEQDLLRSGAIIRKFWLHINSDEQLQRFIARRDDPQKQWKITDEDWRNRAKWDEYARAADEMLQRTHTPGAPWVVVPAGDKRYARIQVLRTVVRALEDAAAE